MLSVDQDILTLDRFFLAAIAALYVPLSQHPPAKRIQKLLLQKLLIHSFQQRPYLNSGQAYCYIRQHSSTVKIIWAKNLPLPTPASSHGFTFYCILDPEKQF